MKVVSTVTPKKVRSYSKFFHRNSEMKIDSTSIKLIVKESVISKKKFHRCAQLSLKTLPAQPLQLGKESEAQGAIGGVVVARLDRRSTPRPQADPARAAARPVLATWDIRRAHCELTSSVIWCFDDEMHGESSLAETFLPSRAATH